LLSFESRKWSKTPHQRRIMEQSEEQCQQNRCLEELCPRSFLPWPMRLHKNIIGIGLASSGWQVLDSLVRRVIANVIPSSLHTNSVTRNFETVIRPKWCKLRFDATKKNVDFRGFSRVLESSNHKSSSLLKEVHWWTGPTFEQFGWS
jgi:hypothetical protein